MKMYSIRDTRDGRYAGQHYHSPDTKVPTKFYKRLSTAEAKVKTFNKGLRWNGARKDWFELVTWELTEVEE